MNKKHIYKDMESLCKAVADHIADLSRMSIANTGKFTIALSGGNTPRKLYEMLAEPPYDKLLDWKHFFIFWGDERCVPLSDENNNSHMAYKALINKIAIPAENVFPIPVNFEPAAAADSYEQTLLTFFKEKNPHFDLILLGLGDNGHTASLFPYTPILQEKERLVKEVYLEELKMYRISFTARLINAAKNILLLVSGEGKAAIMNTIFSKVNDPEKYPVQLIKPVKANLDWYLDDAAASGLKETK